MLTNIFFYFSHGSDGSEEETTDTPTSSTPNCSNIQSNSSNRSHSEATENEKKAGSSGESSSFSGPIQTAFKTIQSYKEGGSQNTKILNAILYFICKDYRPFYAIEGKGFQRLMKEVAPLYKIPCASTVKNALDMKYDVISGVYKKMFFEIPHFSITCDIWSEMMTCRSFLGITVHYISGNKLCSLSIEVHELSERHTASYIGAQMKELLHKWNIDQQKVVACVTDSGANMVSAMHQTFGKDRHIPCFAHLINLVTDHILTPKPKEDEQQVTLQSPKEHISAVIEKVRAIVKWVKNSVNNSDELRKLQINATEGGIPKKVILDVKTRWNSTYYMLERFKELAGILNDLLLFASKAPIMVNAVEMVQIKEIICLLKPLEFITKELSGENYVTISKVIPMINCLINNIETIHLEIHMVIEVKQQLQAELKKKIWKNII